MSDWLAAGDALVHSTGGLTVLEAHVRGCPTISYGWGRGHIRANNEAFLRFGYRRRREVGPRAARGVAPRARRPARAGPDAGGPAVCGVDRARPPRVIGAGWLAPPLRRSLRPVGRRDRRRVPARAT